MSPPDSFVFTHLGSFFHDYDVSFFSYCVSFLLSFSLSLSLSLFLYSSPLGHLFTLTHWRLRTTLCLHSGTCADTRASTNPLATESTMSYSHPPSHYHYHHHGPPSTRPTPSPYDPHGPGPATPFRPGSRHHGAEPPLQQWGSTYPGGDTVTTGTTTGYAAELDASHASSSATHRPQPSAVPTTNPSVSSIHQLLDAIKHIVHDAGPQLPSATDATAGVATHPPSPSHQLCRAHPSHPAQAVTAASTASTSTSTRTLAPPDVDDKINRNSQSQV
jgi:hypothetical protein